MSLFEDMVRHRMKMESCPSCAEKDAELKRLREAKEGICECGADAKQCAENREHHKIHLNRMGGE